MECVCTRERVMMRCGAVKAVCIEFAHAFTRTPLNPYARICIPKYSITINARPYNFIQMSACVRRRSPCANCEGRHNTHSDILVLTHIFDYAWEPRTTLLNALRFVSANTISTLDPNAPSPACINHFEHLRLFGYAY